jgi:hypothetical protein
VQDLENRQRQKPIQGFFAALRMTARDDGHDGERDGVQEGGGR